MFYLASPRRPLGSAGPLALLGAVTALLIGFGLLSARGVDWILLKRALRAKFGDEGWITTQQLADWLADEQRPAPVLLDVRTAEEWQVSHLRGARRVDPQAGVQAAAGNLARDARIVVYCAVGYRSGALAERLRADGYTRVQNLEGSIFQWANEHRPLVREATRVTRVHPYNAFWGRLLAPEARAPLP